MKIIALSLMILILSFHRTFPQYQLADDYIKTESFDIAKKNFTFKNLRIYPLLSGQKFTEAHKYIGKYTNLEEALNKKMIEITETGVADTTRRNQQQNNIPVINNLNNQDIEFQQNSDDNQIQQQEIQQYSGSGDQVNKLFIKNLSKDSIYIMAGEIIKGGKQDRTIAQDMVLPPMSAKIEMNVFCVEHGRWSYKGEAGKFSEYFTVGSNQVRKVASKEKNQQAVWDEVAKVTNANQASSGTGTYTAINQSAEYTQKYQEYLEYFTKAFANMNNCIGFVAVTGKKVMGCDIFATNFLFQKQLKNLLSAYISEVITTGSNVEINNAQVTEYLQKFLSTETGQDKVLNERGVQFKYNNKLLHLNTFE